MLTPEQLISNLQSQIENLTKELEQSQKDIRDFEVLAIEWKKGYKELETKHRIQITEKDQIIKELEEEIEELKTKSV